MTKQKLNGLVTTVYLLVSVAFLLFLALDNDIWTFGVKNGYDRAIIILFAFLMGTLVAGNRVED